MNDIDFTMSVCSQMNQPLLEFGFRLEFSMTNLPKYKIKNSHFSVGVTRLVRMKIKGISGTVTVLERKSESTNRAAAEIIWLEGRRG